MLVIKQRMQVNALHAVGVHHTDSAYMWRPCDQITSITQFLHEEVVHGNSVRQGMNEQETCLMHI